MSLPQGPWPIRPAVPGTPIPLCYCYRPIVDSRRVIPPPSTSYRECIDLSRQADARPSPIEAQLDDDDDGDLPGHPGKTV
jgi:hypothetical protein